MVDRRDLTTVRRCMEEGLVGGEGFAADASLIRANANNQRSAEGSEAADWSDLAELAVRCEHPDTLDEAAFGRGEPGRSRSSSRRPIRRRDGRAPWRHRFFAYATTT